MKLIKVVAIPICLAMGTQALGDWAYDMTSEKCSPEARRIVADSTRNQIENSVRRAEASIDAPTPIGDLSCLAGLMQLPLGSFASTGNLGSIFGTSLQSLINPNGNIINQYCARAEREWRKATRSLGRNTGNFNNFELPSYFHSRLRQASTGQSRSVRQSRGSEVDTPNTGNVGNNSYQALSTENTPPNNGVQQGAPLDADQSIEGIWDTIYGKELDQ